MHSTIQTYLVIIVLLVLTVAALMTQDSPKALAVVIAAWVPILIALIAVQSA